MLPAGLVIVAAGAFALLASRFRWWATKTVGRMGHDGGILLVRAAFAGALVIAWLLTRAAYGGR